MQSDSIEAMMENSKARIGSFAHSFIHLSKGTFMSTYYMPGIESGKGTIQMRTFLGETVLRADMGGEAHTEASPEQMPSQARSGRLPEGASKQGLGGQAGSSKARRKDRRLPREP